MEISINKISPPEIKENKNKKNSGFSGEPQPHPIADREFEQSFQYGRDVREIPSYDAIRKINQKKEDFGIWISTNKLDHVRTWNAKFNFKEKEEKELFYKIEVGLGIVKYNTNKWITPIKKEDGYLLSIHLCKNLDNKKIQGTVRITIERGFNEDIIFQENFFRIFNFLNIIDYKLLLQLFIDEKKENPLFYVELANPIGPKVIIDEKFKKAHLRCFIHNGKGGRSWIETHIDYSLKIPESEFKGPWLPTANWRDATVEAAKYSDSILFMHSQNQKQFRQVNRDHDVLYNQGYKTGQSVSLIQKNMITHHDLLAETSEITAHINNLNLRYEIGTKWINNNLESIYRTNMRKIKAIQNMNNNLYSTIITESEDIQDLFKNEIRENSIDIVSGLESIQKSNHKEHQKDHKEHQKSIEKIEKKLDSIDKKLDSNFEILSEKLSKEFHSLKSNFKNTLYLLLRNESNNHEITISELKEKAKIPRTTLLYHLKKLQEKGYIEVDKKSNGKRGRPPKLYKIHKKIKNLIKKK